MNFIVRWFKSDDENGLTDSFKTKLSKYSTKYTMENKPMNMGFGNGQFMYPYQQGFNMMNKPMGGMMGSNGMNMMQGNMSNMQMNNMMGGNSMNMMQGGMNGMSPINNMNGMSNMNTPMNMNNQMGNPMNSPMNMNMNHQGNSPINMNQQGGNINQSVNINSQMNNYNLMKSSGSGFNIETEDKKQNQMLNGKYTCRYEIQIENDKEFQVARRLIGAKVRYL